MVEAMIELTPEYYSKHRKFYRYLITHTEPQFQADFANNFAFGSHSKAQNSLCSIDEQHYHVLFEVNGRNILEGKAYRVPCMYSTYFYLLYSCDGLRENGEMFEKLHRAVVYNERMGENSFFKHPKNNRVKIPILETKRDAAVQTEQMSTIPMYYLLKTLNSSHGASLCKIFDIINDGKGCLTTSSISFTLTSNN